MVSIREQAIWGIHGGKTGDADALLLKHNVIPLGWHEMGDLSRLSPDREAFKLRVAEVYPDQKPGAISQNAGQLFRFVHEMQTGDLVVYFSKRDRQIYLGKVGGAYIYNREPEPRYPNHRPVQWVKTLPHTHFPLGAVRGSPRSFFQVQKYAEEFRAALL